jgi:hypothetical protein
MMTGWKTPDAEAHPLRRLGICLGLLPAILLMVIPLAQAQDCEIPLFVKQSLHGANVMILADNSGSMNQAVFHLRYQEHLRYDGPFGTDWTYYVSKGGKKKASAILVMGVIQPIWKRIW